MDAQQLKKYQKYAMSRLEKEFKLACRSGNLELVEFFIFSKDLPKNVNPLVDNCAGLRWACGNNKLEVVKFFLESPKLAEHAKVNINSNEPFRRAAENGNIEVVRYLMSKQEFRDKIEVHEWSDYALRKACANRHLDMVEFLLFSPEMSENSNVNAVSIADIEYGATTQMREDPKPMATKLEILELLLKDKRLGDSYQIDKEDVKLLTESDMHMDLLKYIIVELEKELKINPKRYIHPSIQTMMDKVAFKNKLLEKLPSKDNESKKLKI